MGTPEIVLLTLCGIATVIMLVYMMSTSGSNDTCYNCEAQLPFGQASNYVIKQKDGTYQNICKSCNKRLNNMQSRRKGKYW